MQNSGLNNNIDRRKFWQTFAGEREGKLLEEALQAIDPVSARVLRWHYIDGYNFTVITRLLQRSISTVRNHHNRGIFELQKYIFRTTGNNILRQVCSREQEFDEQAFDTR